MDLRVSERNRVGIVVGDCRAEGGACTVLVIVPARDLYLFPLAHNLLFRKIVFQRFRVKLLFDPDSTYRHRHTRARAGAHRHRHTSHNAE